MDILQNFTFDNWNPYQSTHQIANQDERPLSKDYGKICGIKSLYQTKVDQAGFTSWTTEMPTDIEEVAESSETEQYALLVRKKKCYDGRRKFSVDSIVVQSPVLKSVLGSVFKNYPGVTVNVRRLEFQAPWHPFVHRWAKLVQLKQQLAVQTRLHANDEAAAEKRDCVNLLYDVLWDELRETVNTRDDLMRQEVITFDLIWTLFEPESIALSGNDAMKITAGSSSTTGYHISAAQIDWDGSKFGFSSHNQIIPPFSGTSSIQSLPIYPLACRSDAAKVKQDILDRAVRFERLCGPGYKQYDGSAEYLSSFGRSKQVVHGRIVLDTESWNISNPNHQVFLPPLRVATKNASTDENTINSDSQKSEKEHECRLTEDQLLITPSTMRGYSTRDKKWMFFEINNISEITWNPNAFTDLVLPAKHKELILTVAESQATNSTYFDDIIVGKGQGMILLLSGPPGVGKTLTAETVAEVMKVPLYYLSTVDLGSDARSVEETLSKVFQMVTKWNAVLLLDEADVFMEQRTTHDLERNKLVSAMLRMIEYYTGFLILTSNRSDTIDSAFQSRIHIRLSYTALTADSRRTIWRNFIRALSYKNDVSDADIEALATRDLNGRQIKNLLKTAVLLAARKGESLVRRHLEFVLEIDPQC